MGFQFQPLEIPDVVLIRTTRFGDQRGWFAETYKQSEFVRHGIADAFVQDNHSFSAIAGTLRGLHFQLKPKAQGKLVRCLAGAIFDAAVDLRAGSRTYGRWVAAELRAEDSAMLWLPVGFAHGFQTLVPDTQVAYKTTAEYDPQTERGIRWDDPVLAIRWPDMHPNVSDRDSAFGAWDPSTSPFAG